MATNLTPDFLKQLMDFYANPNNANAPMLSGGMAYTPNYSNYSYQSPESGGSGNPVGTGFMNWDAVDPSASPKSRQISEYDAQGNYTGARADTYSPLALDLLKFAGMAAGLSGLGGLMTAGMGGAAGGAAAASGGYGGTSMFGATGGMTPAAMEAALGTAGYGMTGTIMPELAALGLNGAGAGLDFLGNPLQALGTSGTPLTPWEAMNDYGTQFINAAEPAVEGGIKTMAGLEPWGGVADLAELLPMSPLTGTPAMPGLGGLPGLSGIGAGLSALSPAISPTVSAPGFWDKLATNTTDFLSSPANLLKTVATIGALTEGGGDGSVTQTKTLPPELQALLSGPNGLYGQLQTWMNNNPNGQNQTMRDAQTGMRNFLLDPNLIGSFYRQGATGAGLLNTPVAKNPWST